MTRESLAAEHRLIEEPLDQLAALVSGLTAASLPAIREAHNRLRERWQPHFEMEEARVFPALRERVPATVSKMREQHDWVRELDAWLVRLLAEEHPDLRDLERCLRQLLAILQHHLLEEERDLLPHLG